MFCKEDRAILCRECDVPVHTASEITRRHSRFLLTGVRLSSAPVDTLAPSGEEGDQEVEELENSRSPCNDGDSCSGSAGAATAATASDGSSISEYLTKTLPGWHVEDFLVDDAYAGACSDDALIYQVSPISSPSPPVCRFIDRISGTQILLRATIRTGHVTVWSCLGAARCVRTGANAPDASPPPVAGHLPLTLTTTTFFVNICELTIMEAACCHAHTCIKKQRKRPELLLDQPVRIISRGDHLDTI